MTTKPDERDRWAVLVRDPQHPQLINAVTLASRKDAEAFLKGARVTGGDRVLGLYERVPEPEVENA